MTADLLCSANVVVDGPKGLTSIIRKRPPQPRDAVIVASKYFGLESIRRINWSPDWRDNLWFRRCAHC